MKAAGLVAALATLEVWAGDAIRLRNRTIDPGRCGGAEPCAPRRFVPPRGRRPQHYIVQFRFWPGPEIRQELARRHIRVLAYVPDSALMVSTAAPLDLSGLDVTWTGVLQPSDKLSPALSSEPTAAWLVIFQPDADMNEARALVDGLGFTTLENPSLLPRQLLVSGTYSRLTDLAASDDVAYIIPASADLAAGVPLAGCGGPLTEAGPVGEYVQIGSGWPKDPGGGVTLKYSFRSMTTKLDEDTVRGEIERAFREWARYANITFTPAQQAQAARSIDILFARGAHGDGYPFDGPGSVLAHTFYPAPPNSETIAGDMHFDADELWRSGADVDLFSVALHEAGHALGLGHSDRPGSVMYPYYRMTAGLHDDDIAGIRSLYGAAGSQPAQPPVQPPVEPPVQPPAQPPSQPPSEPPAQPPSGTDTTPPSLRIGSPGFTIAATSAASIAVSGAAADNVGVTAVKWSTSTGSSGIAAGIAHWSATVPLLVGDNVITVRAYDAAGNSAWRSLTVVRR